MDLQQPETENPEPEEHILDPNEPEPVVITPFHFGLLCFCTFGIYHVWWQFKCWRYFKLKEDADTFPVIRALFFLFFGIELFNKIAIYSESQEPGHKVKYNSVLVWLACLGINFMGYLPSPYFLFGIFTFLPMMVPLMELNFYFTGNKNGYKEDKLNDRQTILIVLGIACWLLMIFGLFFDKNIPK